MQPLEVRLHLECVAHTTQLEVPEPKVAVGEPGRLGALFEHIRPHRHRSSLLARGDVPAGRSYDVVGVLTHRDVGLAGRAAEAGEGVLG